MGYIDIHSHILPNMDDGSRNMEQSLAMLKIACEQGITTIFATPHNMPGKGCPPAKLVYDRIEALRERVAEENLPIEIIAGTEYYYREEVLDILEAEAGVTMGDSDCVLVEFDPMAEKNYITNGLRNILGLGYQPVIAHVERYMKIMEDKAILHDYKKMGVLIQINAASVTGDNGRHAKKDTKKLLKEGLVDFIGTDAHSDRHRAPYMEECAKILYKKYGRKYADALLGGNAEYYMMEGTV